MDTSLAAIPEVFVSFSAESCGFTIRILFLRSTFVLGLFRGKALRLVAEVCGCKLTQCESRLDGRMLQYPVLLEAIVMHSRT